MSERWRRLFTLLVYPGSYFYRKEPQGILHLPLTWRSFALTSSALVATLVLPELIIWNLLSLWHVSIVWIKLISFILTLMVLFLVLNKAGESLSSVPGGVWRVCSMCRNLFFCSLGEWIGHILKGRYECWACDQPVGEGHPRGIDGRAYLPGLGADFYADTSTPSRSSFDRFRCHLRLSPHQSRSRKQNFGVWAFQLHI